MASLHTLTYHLVTARRLGGSDVPERNMWEVFRDFNEHQRQTVNIGVERCQTGYKGEIIYGRLQKVVRGGTK